MCQVNAFYFLFSFKYKKISICIYIYVIYTYVCVYVCVYTYMHNHRSTVSRGMVQKVRVASGYGYYSRSSTRSIAKERKKKKGTTKYDKAVKRKRAPVVAIFVFLFHRNFIVLPFIAPLFEKLKIISTDVYAHDSFMRRTGSIDHAARSFEITITTRNYK